MNIKQLLLLSNYSALPVLNGVDGVDHKASGDTDAPAKEEGHDDTCLVSDHQGLQGVVQTKVQATVDEDSHGSDGEASVQAPEAITLEGLGVHIDDAAELPLPSPAPGVSGQPGSGVVQ